MRLIDSTPRFALFAKLQIDRKQIRKAGNERELWQDGGGGGTQGLSEATTVTNKIVTSQV